MPNDKYINYDGSLDLLNVKHELFCQSYVENSDRYKAAEDAGYSGTKDSMAVCTSRLLRNVNILKRIEYLRKLKIEETKKVWRRNALDVLNDINLIKERCMGNVLDHNLKPYKIDHKTAIKCLELEGKYLGMWEKESSTQYPEVIIGGEEELEE